MNTREQKQCATERLTTKSRKSGGVPSTSAVLAERMENLYQHSRGFRLEYTRFQVVMALKSAADGLGSPVF